ncbi:MAG: DUF1592 domain-containing protein [Planctomycetota bacterium]|nr:MAG: DUF1592 domain-containing protein [Planctomycetota bacterium]
MPLMFLSSLTFCVFAILLCAAAYGEDGPETSSRLALSVLPIFQSHCQNCHGAKEQAGDLRLDTLSTDLNADKAVAEKWQRILDMLEAGEMPPKKAKQLRPSKRKKLTTSIASAVNEAIEIHSKTDRHRVPRRLNRVEYANTMRDLLGLNMDYARDIPSDALSADGFNNDGQALQMSAEHLACYLDTARRAMEKVVVSGPAPRTYNSEFTKSNVGNWKGNVEFSNRLGRQQEFIVKMVDDYPEQGDFLIRVRLSAELKPNIGFPLVKVSLGYRPDTQVLFREVGLVEITEPEERLLEFRGRVEEFPLPVRGQGKFPGLVVMIRNAYDDGSPLHTGEQSKEKEKKWTYPNEPNLPTILIHSVEFQGPLTEEWPPISHRKILNDSNLRETDEKAYVAEMLGRFMPRAYRRPVESTEVDRLLEFFQAIRPEFPTFEEAIRETLSMVLISPQFLFFMDPASDPIRSIDDWTLASRLSFFLWSTQPDEELRSLAASSQIHEPELLSQQVERLLQDPKSSQFVEQFTDQWLKIDKLSNIAVSRDRFHHFDDRIKADMQRETQQFFRELLDHDWSALNLLKSDFVVVNERMAKHYGIEGVWGNSFRRVPIAPELHRGGLLSQASVLLSNSTGRDSHPVRRAVWLRDRILNDPPSPPPADVPPLNQADPKFLEMSVRQQMEIHRNTESCARCHSHLDPWGIALENFDAIGLWRDEVKKPLAKSKEITIADGMLDEVIATNKTTTSKKEPRQPIDTIAVFSDGRQIDGVDQLKEYLITERSKQFAGSLVSRLLTYALGRKLELVDQPAIEKLTLEFVADGYRLKPLIKKIVATSAFQAM